MTHEEMPLDALCVVCIQQLQRYRQLGAADVASCDEILRRAAAHDQAAIAALLHISELLVRRGCPRDLYLQIDDWTQEVLLRVMQKMQSRSSPYVLRPPPPQPFVAYQAFLKKVMQNVSFEQRRRLDPVCLSIDALEAATGDALPSPQPELDELHRLMRFERLLGLIPHPLEREIFRLRFQLKLSPAETVAMLAGEGLVVTKQQIFRAVERIVRALAAMPEVRDLFES